MVSSQQMSVSGASPWSGLPDELLLMIFEALVSRPHSRKAYKLVSILRVCRRWKLLFEPIFYHTLSLGACSRSTLQQDSERIIKLKNHPRVAQHLRCISLRLCNPDSADVYSAAAYVLYQCTAIHTMSLYLTWSAEAQIVIQATKRFQQLESLTLSGPPHSVSIQSVFFHFNLPSLRRLRLARYGITRSNSRCTWLQESGRRYHYQSARSAVNQIAKTVSQGSSSITELDLSLPTSVPEATELAVRWPARLEKMSIKNMTAESWIESRPSFERYYTVQALQRILDIHRLSLTHITVGMLPGIRGIISPEYYGPGHVPTLSSFPALRFLQISAIDFFSDEPAKVAQKLCAPGLECLVLDFNLEHFGLGYQCKGEAASMRFDMEKVKALDIFAARYTMELGLKNNLRTIHIDYYMSPSTETWPWENYIMEARDRLGCHGIVLS